MSSGIMGVIPPIPRKVYRLEHRSMENSFDDKLLGFLKRHPHVVERFVKEHCTSAQLNEWLRYIEKRDANETVQERFKHESPSLNEERKSFEGLFSLHLEKPQNNVSTQLLRAAELNKTNRELVFHDMIQAILDCVPVDGHNLFLRDPTTERLHLQDLKASKKEQERILEALDIHSRKNLVCYAAEKKQYYSSTDMNTECFLPQMSIIPSPMAEHVAAHPILNPDKSILGVMEVYRSASRRPFTSSEMQLIQSHIRWAQLLLELDEKLMASAKAQHLADFIMEVTRNLFSRIKNMDSVIKGIMQHAKELVKAERVTLFLVDHKKNELYSSILDMGDVTCSKFVQDETSEIRVPIDQGIVGYVARTGCAIRTNDAYSDERFYRKVDESRNQVTRSILAMPLVDGKEVLGVVEMINKYEGSFTEEDESLLKVYCTYCGLAINVARMYDRIYRSDRKYRVALEVLTYHSCVSSTDVEKALPCDIPDDIPGITRHDFSPWDVDEMQEMPTVLYMMYDLAGKLLFDKTTLLRFVLTVRKNYRPVAYHNWDHGFSVAHSMYFVLKSGENQFTPLERTCLFIASLCHDLDHRGYDNRFMKKFSTPLASLYSSSPMEHHHFNMTITILQQKDHNIFRYFRNASYRTILGIIKHAILSTDLAGFWTAKAKLDQTLDLGLDWDNYNDRMSIVSIAMPMCDLCAMYKPWDIQVKVVMLIMQEFWAQGDQEKASDSKPLSLMDRDEAVGLATGQVGFIRAICIPCYTTMARVFPQLRVIVDVATENMSRWEQISVLPYADRERILKEQLQQRFQKIANRNRQS